MTAIPLDPAGHIGSRPPAEVDLPAPRLPRRTIIALHGDLDIVAAPTLREELRHALHHGRRILLLDLSDVTSCDTAGLAVLIGTQRHARRLGIILQLTGLRPQIVELLGSVGLERSLTIERHPGRGDARVLEFREKTPR